MSTRIGNAIRGVLGEIGSRVGLVTVGFVELRCKDGVSIGNLRIIENVKVNFLVESVV